MTPADGRERFTRPAHILLVEDNEDEVFLTRRALRDCGPNIHLHHVDDGAKCLAFLRRQPPYENVPVPDLVLLDLNMPVMDGREALKAIQADEALRHLPVVILSTSREQNDINSMYRLGCNSYVAKPVNFERFVELMGQLVDYWLNLVRLPGN
jgi:two-component system response regulator